MKATHPVRRAPMKLPRRYVPPPLGAFGQRVLLSLLVALCVLNVADFVLTRYSLWLGFATESNGVMDFFFSKATSPRRSSSSAS